MTASAVRVLRNTYVDSLLLMRTTVSMRDATGIEWAGAVMATRESLAELGTQGFSDTELDGLDADDLVLAVRGQDEDACAAALHAGQESAAAQGEGLSGAPVERAPTTLAEAARRAPQSNVAIISVPGPYAALEAHHALTAGMHVLLFSDGVPVDEEVELKARATDLGLLVMGPGAGTAVLGGTGLGFANVLAPRTRSTATRSVGVVAAAGTGAQEVSALLDRWAVPVSQVIGVGGRDLSEQVGGATTRLALRALDDDDATDVVLLVSKPPSVPVAEAVLTTVGSTPLVAAFMGHRDVGEDGDLTPPEGVALTPTLEQGAAVAAARAGVDVPPLARGLPAKIAAACERLTAGRVRVSGLFSGGTLCYEAQWVLEQYLGAIWSNEPLREECRTPAPDGAHVLLDVGAEEYTRGVPHPMIDPSGRLELLRAQAEDPTVAVVLLDVVLGHGSHDDPAGQIAPVAAELMADGGPQVMAYVLGTEGDPQGYSAQRGLLEAAGVIVAETNARTAYAAAALVLRDPDVAAAGLPGERAQRRADQS